MSRSLSPLSDLSDDRVRKPAGLLYPEENRQGNQLQLIHMAASLLSINFLYE
jgi:hypothetical protein